jgi:HlyD family secretion protein
MNRILVGIVLAAIATVAGFSIWKSNKDKSSRENESQTISTQPRKIVSAMGRLEPESTVLRLAPASGNEGACVYRLMVQKGDDVQAGHVLAVMDTFDRRNCAVLEAEANASAARAKLAQIEAGSKKGDLAAAEAANASAKAQLRVAKRDLDRVGSLRSTNAISEEEVDMRRWSYDRAIQELARTEGVLESLREIRLTDVEAQKAMIAVSVANLQSAKANLEATQLRSPIDGRVLEIYARAGERPSDRGVLEIGSVQKMQAIAEVYEGDVGLVKTGQKAFVHLETCDREFTGTVVEIGHMIARKVVLTNDPVSDTDARVLEVRIAIDPEHIPSVARMSNARIQVRLEVAEHE